MPEESGKKSIVIIRYGSPGNARFDVGLYVHVPAAGSGALNSNSRPVGQAADPPNLADFQAALHQEAEDSRSALELHQAWNRPGAGVGVAPAKAASGKALVCRGVLVMS